MSGQQHEQRRRIDAAVILSERNLAQRGHFAAAHLVQDLAGFGVGERIEFLGLEISEPLQHALGDARIEPQHLQRRDQPVAAERGRIPGNAGVGVSALRRLGHEHVEVGHRLAQHLVEDVVGTFDAGNARGRTPHLAAMRQEPAEERRRLLHDRLVAGDRDEQRRRLLGCQFEFVSRGIHRQPRRLWVEMQRGDARLRPAPDIPAPRRSGRAVCWSGHRVACDVHRAPRTDRRSHCRTAVSGRNLRCGRRGFAVRSADRRRPATGTSNG